MRVLWMAEELELEFSHIPYEFDDPALKQPSFLKLNPAGAIPTIVDQDFALSESLAINLYLAKTHSLPDGRSLHGLNDRQEALMISWTLWVQGHIEPWVQKDAMLQSFLTNNQTEVDRIIDRSLVVLERVLSTSTWLVDDRFTVADLNVAAVLSPSRASTLDLSDVPRVDDWLRRCYERPAAIAARQRAAAAGGHSSARQEDIR
jgi:glutathione S-transferase